jgi:hypothetical protein
MTIILDRLHVLESDLFTNTNTRTVAKWIECLQVVWFIMCDVQPSFGFESIRILEIMSFKSHKCSSGSIEQ